MIPTRSADPTAIQSDLLTIREVATDVRVNQKTVRRWIQARELPAYRIGRQWRISRTELQQFLHKRWHG